MSRRIYEKRASIKPRNPRWVPWLSMVPIFNKTKNAIMISENLIKTKGFNDVIIFSNDDSISVVINKEELAKEDIAQIQSIIAREMNAKIDDIHIMNK